MTTPTPPAPVHPDDPGERPARGADSVDSAIGGLSGPLGGPSGFLAGPAFELTESESVPAESVPAESGAADPAPPLAPEHPMVLRLTRGSDLGSQVRSGFAWAGVSRVGFQLLQFISTILLARLLIPADYGLAAIVNSVTGFGAIFVDLGMTAALVQSRRVTEDLMATAFWLSLGMGVAISLLVAALAVPLAGFFHQPRLAGLLALAGLSFVLSESAVHVALLQRTLNFKTIGTVETGAGALGLVTSIACAAAGLGAYSLVIGPLVGSVAVTAGYWNAVRWLPRTGVTRSALRRLWEFGGGLTGFNIVNYWSRNTDNIVLGRFSTVTDLGYYGRAYNLMLLPVSQLSTIVSRVLFPALAAISHDRERFGRAWLRTVRVVWLFGIPTGLGIAASAHFLVAALYGARWLGMVPALALLALSVPPQLVGSNLGPAYQALGRTGLQFRLGLVTSAISVGAIFAGLPWGFVGVAAALTIKSWVTLAIPAYPVLRMMSLSPKSILSGVWRLVIAGAAMAGAVYALGVVLGPRLPVELVFGLQLVLGAVVYLILIVALEAALLTDVLPSRIYRHVPRLARMATR